MADWMPLLGGIAEGVGTYMGQKANAEAQQYIADIQRQIAELSLSGDKYQADIARLTALETAAVQYPGQMETGKSLSEYLQSKVGLGLSEEEKGHYRSTGKAAIEKGISGALESTETAYASQGLKGGSVAETLGGIASSRPELYGGLESRIMEADIGAKQRNIEHTLAFLQTSAAPRSPGGESAQPTTPGGAKISGGVGGLPSGAPSIGLPVAVGGSAPPTFSGGRKTIQGTATPFTQPFSIGLPQSPSGGGGGGGMEPSIADALSRLGANPNISSAQFRHRADILRGVELSDPNQYYGVGSGEKNLARTIAERSGVGGFTTPYKKVGIGGAWSY